MAAVVAEQQYPRERLSFRLVTLVVTRSKPGHNRFRKALRVETSRAKRMMDYERPTYRAGEEVALFIPCYVDQFFPQVAEATTRLLQSLDVTVVFPKGQTCCGQPAFNSGYFEEAKRVVRHFCKVFQQYQWIVTPSGSCAAMCRNFFKTLDASQEVGAVGSRVFELTEFLVDVLGVREIEATYPHKVTMHIGCHTRRELGIFEQPMMLIKRIKGLLFCELPEAEECCGFGGAFSVKMPELSLSMGRAKVDAILESGAEVVASTDMSCLMHISGIMQRVTEAKHIQIKHIAEILVAGQNR
jgi:L-lactate dehydrogenase complex protein LldE